MSTKPSNVVDLTRPRPGPSTDVLRDEVAEMMLVGNFRRAKLAHVPFVFEGMHRRVHGGWPSDKGDRIDRVRGEEFVREHFKGNVGLGIQYLQWAFAKAHAEKRVLPFGLVFSDTLRAEYEAEESSVTDDAPSDEADQPSTPATTSGSSRFERGDQVEIAKQLLSDLSTGGVVKPVSAFGAIQRYGDVHGVWRALEHAELSRHVQGYAGKPIAGQRGGLKVRSADVNGAVSLAHARIADPEYFANAPRGIAFANGFAKFNADGAIELVPHAPENRARFAYPFAYDEQHPRKAFIRFARSLFRDDDDVNDKVRLIAEFVGGSLLGVAPRYQKCLVGKGGGNNGKSAVLDVLTAAMPPGSTAAIPPQSWGQEYRRALLAGKLLNVVSELPEQDIIAAEAFKAIVTGDAIDAREIRGVPFTFRPTAGHVFAANALPGSSDQTEGFWRRFLVLTFNRSISKEERNPRIAEELIASELPGIVMWLLTGASRLIRQGHYTTPASHHAAMREWRRNADQVSAFVEECTRPLEGKDRGVAAADAYKAYSKWATANGHRPVSSTKFGMRLKALDLGSKHTKQGNLHPFTLNVAGKLL